MLTWFDMSRNGSDNIIDFFDFQNIMWWNFDRPVFDGKVLIAFYEK